MANSKLKDILAQARNEQGYDCNVKTAHDQGVEDAESMIKVARYTGDVIGQQVVDTALAGICESFGYDPGVLKTASISDVIDDAVACSFMKIAEQISGQTGGAELQSTALAEAGQLVSEGKSHATMAVQAANDAVASVSQGDANTATKSMEAAANSLATAKQIAEVVPDPELANQVQIASQEVGNAAQAVASTAVSAE